MNSEPTVIVTDAMIQAARDEITPEFLEWFDQLTDEDIAGQERGDPYYIAANAYPRFLRERAARLAAAETEASPSPAK